MSDELLSRQLEGIGSYDFTEYRIFGPPGTGKTTYLSRQVMRAVAKYGPDAVMVTSFSRAAAAALVSRDLPLKDRQIGTLHSHCYQALGCPRLAEDRIREWNRDHPEAIMGDKSEADLDEGIADSLAGGAETPASLDLKEAKRMRNLLRPVETWESPSAVRLHEDWTEWKEANGLIDFTDLIEMAVREFKFAPGRPRVIFGDEAQDFTPLQLQLVRQWGNHGDYFVIVGDDDQTIYDFAGASPFAFIKPEIPNRQKIVLSQSYRVPREAHSLASAWIRRIAVREPKAYRPTENQGRVVFAAPDGIRHGFCYKRPEFLVDDIEKQIARGRTVMILAACSYMLPSTISELRRRGIPFHNRYRTKRGDWNPLLRKSKQTWAGDRVLALLAAHGPQGRPWTGREFRLFAEWLRAQGEDAALARGVKASLPTLAPEMVVTEDQLREWIAPREFARLEYLLDADRVEFLNWWLEHVDADRRSLARYLCAIVARRGVAAIGETPKVCVGTIHSVKGGEADVVYLFPDLSPPANRAWTSGMPRLSDPIVRQFYVGMTRAKDTLVVCGASDPGSSAPLAYSINL